MPDASPPRQRVRCSRPPGRKRCPGWYGIRVRWQGSTCPRCRAPVEPVVLRRERAVMVKLTVSVRVDDLATLVPGGGPAAHRVAIRDAVQAAAERRKAEPDDPRVTIATKARSRVARAAGA